MKKTFNAQLRPLGQNILETGSGTKRLEAERISQEINLLLFISNGNDKLLAEVFEFVLFIRLNGR